LVFLRCTLIFSSIGYVNQEVAVAGRGVINILLAPDAEALDDVVVVAYGTAKKESVTGAVSTVKADAIEHRPISSVTNALEGTVSGVIVNSTYGRAWPRRYHPNPRCRFNQR